VIRRWAERAVALVDGGVVNARAAEERDLCLTAITVVVRRDQEEPLTVPTSTRTPMDRA
jgi:hypothetical protein